MGARGDVPRYLRFACAIALSSTAGCYASHEIAGVTPVRDASVRTDAPIVGRDAPLGCSDCDCGWTGIDVGATPRCESVGLGWCCAAVGPLAPPDLPG